MLKNKAEVPKIWVSWIGLCVCLLKGILPYIQKNPKNNQLSYFVKIVLEVLMYFFLFHPFKLYYCLKVALLQVWLLWVTGGRQQIQLALLAVCQESPEMLWVTELVVSTMLAF